jgi:Mg2+ and Co2+ transporter CorA
LCFYLENYLTLPGLTPETPDLVLLFARKIVASLYSRHLDHVHQAVIRSQVPMRRHSDFIGLDLATVEANWSSRQTLEKPLHQYCYDLEHILAQMRVPLQRPDLAQVTSWRDVHVDFQMLHHRFENARNWVSKINASITGLTGIVGNRQAFREQQLSLEAAVRTQNITTLGLLFVPLAYVATLFSMSGEYGPGGDRFWLYFLIAFPVTMVVMVAFVAMGWVRERNIKR